MANTDFKNCLGIVRKGSRVIEFQFNRQYDIDNDIWYKMNNDFFAEEWQQTLDYDTEDLIYSGDPRKKQETTAFTETFEITLKENYNQAFYRELSAVMDTDQGLIDFSNGGLNIRITIYFDNTTWKRVTYMCCSPNPSQRVYHQNEGTDATFDMPTLINFESPLIELNGFNVPLPAEIDDVKFTYTLDRVINNVTLSISAIEDNNNLILDKPNNIRVIIYDNTGVVNYVAYGNSADVPISVTHELVGDMTVEISYLYLINSYGNLYRTVVVESI